MNCKNLKFRSKKRKMFVYCTVLKREITFDTCKNCPYKEYKQYNTLKQRTNKQNKKEKERFSIITPDLTKCAICGSKWGITKHEIFGGRNRSNSIKYGLILPLCLNCHISHQNDKVFNDCYHKLAQELWESKYGTREDFIKIFGKNYLIFNKK